jgi:multidrug efflux pump subunit AcrA (membrane-fusion protein)
MIESFAKRTCGLVRWCSLATNKKRRWWLIGLVVVAVLGAAGLYWGGFFGHSPAAAKPSARPEKPPVPVTVEAVKTRPIRRTVSVVGSLWGHDEVQITPKVEGRVRRVYHDIGDVVRPGDTLLELDPADYQLAVEEARRALELELAKLGMKELPTGNVEVAKLPMVVKAAAQESNAASRRERMRRLAGAGSAEDRELAETEYAVAKANFNQAVLEAETTLAAARHRRAAFHDQGRHLTRRGAVPPEQERRRGCSRGGCQGPQHPEPTA